MASGHPATPLFHHHGAARMAAITNLSFWVDPTTPYFARSTSLVNYTNNLTLFVKSSAEEFNGTYAGTGRGTRRTRCPARRITSGAQRTSSTRTRTATRSSTLRCSGARPTRRCTWCGTSAGGAGFLGSQLSSWNRFCFQGGYLEVSFRLPPSSMKHNLGAWTAIWVMGNLARDVYPASVENVWPFSYDECQCPGPSAEYGLPQKISRCDHHGGRYGLNAYQGRGAPELDLLETIQCSKQMTPHLRDFGALPNGTCLITSVQLAPRLPSLLRPLLNALPTEEGDRCGIMACVCNVWS